MPTDIPAPITETAPAKVNLTLHVTGRRADGYHLLDSLVVFAGVGDRLHLSPAPALSLALEGPFAAGIPAGADNLVLRAAAGLARRRAAEGSPGAHRPAAERAAPDAASDVPGGATGGASGWGPHPAGPPPTAADPAAGCPPGDAPDNGRIGGPNDRQGCGPNGGPTPGDAGAAGIGAAIVLEKNLPPASGLGGGSSDAAAALRGLARLWGCAPPQPAEGLALGADVPVCLAGVPVRMAGIGEDLSPCPPLPPAWLVLVNPGVETPTRAVFDALARRDNPAMPATLPAWPDAAALAAWLADQRNDLEAPARALFPVIDAVLAAIGARPGCLLARMSGSGATCFGIFADAAGAARAAAALRAGHPGWWVADAPLQPG